MKQLAPAPCPADQGGSTAVEFALTSMLFFIFIFGIVELARALYMWGTMVEVTQRAARAAAAIDFTQAGQLSVAREAAIFANLPGGLPLRGELGPDNLSVDYLNASLTVVNPLPACPAQNLINCSADPDGASCIRFVRVRLCTAGGGASCTRVDYVPIVGAGFFPGGPLQFPTFAAVTPVTSLGLSPGAAGSCM